MALKGENTLLIPGNLTHLSVSMNVSDRNSDWSASNPTYNDLSLVLVRRISPKMWS